MLTVLTQRLPFLAGNWDETNRLPRRFDGVSGWMGASWARPSEDALVSQSFCHPHQNLSQRPGECILGSGLRSHPSPLRRHRGIARVDHGFNTLYALGKYAARRRASSLT